jgi:hypothetical protein
MTLILRCSLRDLKPQIAAAFPIVDEEFTRAGCSSTVVTSCWREKGKGSLHRFGYAADFDSTDMPEDLADPRWAAIKDEVSRRLGASGSSEYDVLAHASPRVHLHVEWDP